MNTRQPTPGVPSQAILETLRSRYRELQHVPPLADFGPIELPVSGIFVEPMVRACQNLSSRAYELSRGLRTPRWGRDGRGNDLTRSELKQIREVLYRSTPQPALQILNDPDRRLLVILGDLGSGKTTLLRYLALQWADVRETHQAAGRIPLVFDLKQVLAPQDLLKNLAAGLGLKAHLNEGDFEAWLQSNEVVLLLDGLDEVLDPTRRLAVVEAVAKLVLQHPRIRCVLTSRIIGYDLAAPVLRSAGFQHYLVQGFQREQVSNFVRRWSTLVCPGVAEAEAECLGLMAALARLPDGAELSRNPLLLTFTAAFHGTHPLPRARSMLYESITGLLLETWEATKRLPALAVTWSMEQKLFALRTVASCMRRHLTSWSENEEKESAKRSALEQLLPQHNHRACGYALNMAEQSRQAAAYHATAKRWADNAVPANAVEEAMAEQLRAAGPTDCRMLAERFLVELRERHGILHLRDEGGYAFWHQGLFRLFCAGDFVHRYLPEDRVDLEKLPQHVCEFLGADGWEDFIYHVSRYLESDAAAALMDDFVSRPDDRFCLVATRIYDAAPVPVRRVCEPLAARLRERLSKPDQLAIPAFEEEPFASAREGICSYTRGRSATFRSDACIDGEEHSVRPSIQTLAVQTMAECWPQEAATNTWLQQQTQSTNSDICQAAVEKLARGWRLDPDTRPLLAKLARGHPDEWTRLSAVRELICGWRHAPDTRSLMQQLARTDESKYVRETARMHLLQEAQHEPETLPALKQQLQDPGGKDAYSNLWFFIEIWGHTAETLPILMRYAHEGGSEYARQCAFEQLLRYWPRSAETLKTIRDFLQPDVEQHLRVAALQALARGWWREADTGNTLKDLARHDASYSVRLVAVEELAWGWDGDPEVPEILKDRALHDPDHYLASTAVHELAFGWRDERETRPMFANIMKTHINWCAERRSRLEAARHDQDQRMKVLEEMNKTLLDRSLRQSALRSLLNRWPDHPENLPLLRELIRFDNDMDSHAFAEFQQRWRGRPEAWPLLKETVLRAATATLREKALIELLASWLDHPELLPLLRELARGNQELHRREEEAKAKAGLEGTSFLLPRIFARDPDYCIQETAFRALLRFFPQDRDLTLLLTERALNHIDEAQRQVALHELSRWREPGAAEP